MPPRTPVRVRKKTIANKKRALAKRKKDRLRKGLDVDDTPIARALPGMDRLVRSYLRRHEDRVRAGMSPSQSRQEEEYYSKPGRRRRTPTPTSLVGSPRGSSGSSWSFVTANVSGLCGLEAILMHDKLKSCQALAVQEHHVLADQCASWEQK